MNKEERPVKWGDISHPSIWIVVGASLFFWLAIALKVMGILDVTWTFFFCKAAVLLIGVFLLIFVLTQMKG